MLRYFHSLPDVSPDDHGSRASRMRVSPAENMDLPASAGTLALRRARYFNQTWSEVWHAGTTEVSGRIAAIRPYFQSLTPFQKTQKPVAPLFQL